MADHRSIFSSVLGSMGFDDAIPMVALTPYPNGPEDSMLLPDIIHFDFRNI